MEDLMGWVMDSSCEKSDDQAPGCEVNPGRAKHGNDVFYANSDKTEMAIQKKPAIGRRVANLPQLINSIGVPIDIWPSSPVCGKNV